MLAGGFFKGFCRECPILLWNVLMVLSIWFGWYCMNAILCENLETVDQFLAFVQVVST